MAVYRVLAIHKKWKAKGEHEEERVQYLQRKTARKFTWFGLKSDFYWKTIDSEIVPSYAWLSVSCFGDTEWKSKFKDYM